MPWQLLFLFIFVINLNFHWLHFLHMQHATRCLFEWQRWVDSSEVASCSLCHSFPLHLNLHVLLRSFFPLMNNGYPHHQWISNYSEKLDQTKVLHFLLIDPTSECISQHLKKEIAHATLCFFNRPFSPLWRFK